MSGGNAMRVTDQSIYDAAQSSIARARERHARATAVTSTGSRLQHPGDDPAAAGLVATHSVEEARFQSISDGAARASDELAAADGALGSLTDALSRARELAVQLANATYSAAERTAAAGEVTSLLHQAVAALNTEHGGRYLFGGAKDGAPPFDQAGAYSGDGAVRQVEIAPGVYQAASVRADVAVKGGGGGVDALATLTALAAALSGDDVPGIRSALGPLDTAITQVTQARSQAGTAMSVMDTARATSTQARDGARAATAALVNADPFESATQLALAERALEAALAASSRSFKPTLLDVLR
ncbi:MAG TPA: flagellar hook-associated protein FlgL [Myxococcales bacterium]|nr:flagellar hook-associated protein FlgL [Myxococcales bacterium]